MIVRSNGTVTYVGKDIAYHLWKFGLLGRDFAYRRFFEYADRWCWISAETGEADHPQFGGAQAIYNVIDSRQSDPQANVIEALRGLGYTEQAAHYTHFSYEMVALTPRCAIELGYEVSEEDQARPYIEVSGRKGFGVKADDLIDKLIAATRAEVDSRHPELSEAERDADGAEHCGGRAAVLHAAVHAEFGNRVRFQRCAELRGRNRALSAVRRRADAEHLSQGGNDAGRGAVRRSTGVDLRAISQRRRQRGHLGSVAARGQDHAAAGPVHPDGGAGISGEACVPAGAGLQQFLPASSHFERRRSGAEGSCCWRQRRWRSGNWFDRWRGWASLLPPSCDGESRAQGTGNRERNAENRAQTRLMMRERYADSDDRGVESWR